MTFGRTLRFDIAVGGCSRPFVGSTLLLQICLEPASDLWRKKLLDICVLFTFLEYSQTNVTNASVYRLERDVKADVPIGVAVYIRFKEYIKY